MFGMGMPEIILILAIALIVIGPKKLPDLAKSLGRAMGEFKRATTEFKESMDLESNLTNVRSTLADAESTRGSTPESPSPVTPDAPSDTSADEILRSSGNLPENDLPENQEKGIKPQESPVKGGGE